MSLFSWGRSKEEQSEALRALEGERDRARAQLGEVQELMKHLDEERALLQGALEALRPGRTHRELAEALMELCFKPFGLASYYLALMDWERDLIHFVLYHEGGRARNNPDRNFTQQGGLTAKAILSGRPLYLPTLEAARAEGAVFSEAEAVSGLIPQTYYGAPLGPIPGRGDRPFGLVSFQSFQPDAFSAPRLRTMDALAGLLAMALELGER
jgi:hypothetical protein